ncbi:MAG TPA: hypothetical protein ENK34_12785 [Rhodobacteraceae bacterium]|nr:hypothetical protein [Paracoccaceae bacterium]
MFSIVKTIHSVIPFIFRTFLTALKSLKSFLLVIFLVLSIILNVAMFIGGTIYSTASSVFDAVTGLRSVATQHAADIASIGGDLIEERRLNRELRGEVGDLTEELALERSAKRKLRSQLSETAAERAALRAKREAVNATTDRISRRATKAAGREIGSMFGEAIPYVGIAIIVGAATLELNDLCATMKDMQKLREIFDPDAAPDENVTTVCAIKVPTKEEIWAKVKASPREVWEGVKAKMPDLPEFPEFDWSGIWTSIEDGAIGSLDTLKDVSRQTLKGASITADRVTKRVKEIPDLLLDWWSD